MRQKQAHSIKRVFLQLMLSSNRVTLALPEGSRCLVILCFYMQPISNKGKRSAEHRTLKSILISLQFQGPVVQIVMVIYAAGQLIVNSSFFHYPKPEKHPTYLMIGCHLVRLACEKTTQFL